MAKQTVLFALIPEYADWEPALLAAGLRRGFGMWEKTYEVKIVAPDREPATSIGGFRVVPDYDFESAPDDFAALILIGGTDWFGPQAKRVLPLVRKALAKNAVLGAICDASMFLGVNGFLNDVNHTSNDLELLKAKAGAAYSGERKYHPDRQSVRDRNIVTANGAGFAEFSRDVLFALDIAPAETIDAFYRICKTGFFRV